LSDKEFSPVPNDNIDPMIRARFHAIELLLAQLIANRLVLQVDAATSAAEILTRLMAKADRMPLLDAHACEESKIREETHYNLFETLNAALNLAGDRQACEPADEAPCRRRFPGVDRRPSGRRSPDRPPYRPR
jgi:hypothetical protein